MCGGAKALAFDHFVAAFCSFLLCELSSKNPSNMFLNFGKEFLFFGYQHLTLCLTVPKLLFLTFLCVLGPLQSFTVQALNDISLFDGVSQSGKVCGGRLRREMRF